MKRLFAALLALVLLLTCVPALADQTTYTNMGLALDIDALASQSMNYPRLMEFGITSHDPYVSMNMLVYYNAPKETVKAMMAAANNSQDEEEAEQISETLTSVMSLVASIVVTNTTDLAEAGFEMPLPEGYAVNEFGTKGDYHYYCIFPPVDETLATCDKEVDLSRFGDTQRADKDTVRSEFEMLQTELLKQLQAAELSEPVDPISSFIGQVISFESTDLDGNPVSSADLFKDNKITMVNLWGTWCGNCLNEMGELAMLHTRLQEKGCGIVGVEWEQKPIEEVADKARQIFTENGTTYPNVIYPEGNPVFDQVSSFPATFFVDSEGNILSSPIIGAAVDEYEPTIDRLLAGETVNTVPDASVKANDSGKYRVIVCDQEGNPVEGAVIQFCDDTTCTFQTTDSEGVVVFENMEQKIWDIHVLMAPEGYEPDESEYKTLDTYSDVNIILKKAAL